MKKFISNKRGFTLMEIMIVVAIIVILAGAVTIGIFADLRRYNDYKNNLDAAGWEGEARESVAGLVKSEDYSPKYGETETKATDESESETSEVISSEEKENVEVGGDVTDPSDDNQNQNNQNNQNDQNNQNNQNNQQPANNSGSSITVGNKSGTISTGSGSASVGNANDWGCDARYSSVSSTNGGMIYSAVVSVQGSDTSLSDVNWKYKVTPLGDNKYKLEYVANSEHNLPDSSINFVYKGAKGTTGNITVESVELLDGVH